MELINNNSNDVNENKINESNNINELFELIYCYSNKKKKYYKDILKSFKVNPSKINDKPFLILFIEELITQLKLGINIFIPFLEIFPNLIKSYIKSDLDEEGEDLKYNEVFKLLKLNSFISRENLFPIYEYFSDILYEMNKIEENDKKFKKFNKVFELWKIFYNFDINKKELNITNSSSFCFIGGALQLKLPKILLNFCTFSITINFLGEISPDFNQNLILLRIADKEFPFELKYEKIKHLIGGELTITFRLNFIIIQQESYDISIGTEFKTDIELVQELYLLENFYGQIKSIEILQIGNDKKIIINEVFEPYLSSDDGYLFHRLKQKVNNSSNEDDSQNDFKDSINSPISIKIVNQGLVKINFINYLDKNFDLCEYFGGFIPMLPFISLFNGIYKNKSINFINGINKKLYLISLINYILYLLCKILNKNLKKYSKKIKKYSFFFFSLIFQIDLDLILRNKDYIAKEQKYYDEILIMCNSFEEEIINFIVPILNNAKNKEDFDAKILSFKNIFQEKIEIDNNHENNSFIIKYNDKQLFGHLMKELFIYNRFWSNKYLFFKTKENKNDDKYKLKLKYKQISYYTKSFQQPLLYPILEFGKYIPSFSNFDVKNLFKHDLKEIVNYDFQFENNIISSIIDLYSPFNGIENSALCCLVKKNYHVKGEIFIREKKNKKFFEIIFCTKNLFTCNKIKEKQNNPNDGKIFNFNNNNICYGASFPMPQKEINRKIFIKSNDITFMLIRNYYKRTSAIEIFTYKSNKSYYFNFKNIIDLNNLSDNIVLRYAGNNENFKKLTFQKHIIMYYNKKYINVMFPLFSKESNWQKKLKFYNNYDLLTIINLLSNRSFKDLYQYPIFPILYKVNNIIDNIIEQERDLSQHIGMQEINDESRTRKIAFDELYSTYFRNKIINSSCLFNTHYSNSVYVSNYLLRLFPYSFLGIEIQGDGFDSPNRLFFSIKGTMKNTLSQKSDIREFIPELYYLPELFTNSNELKLGTLSNRREIDNVEIKEQDEIPLMKYQFISNLKTYLEFGDLKLNNWINLIFGKNQRTTNDNKNYFGEDLYIYFDQNKQKEDNKDDMIMKQFEFGVQPYKLFDYEFPKLINKSKCFEEIKSYNKEQFIKEHFLIKGDKNKSFICKCSNNKNQNYINIINKNISQKRKSINLKKHLMEKKKIIVLFNYIFIGDVLGNVKIYENQTELNINKDDDEEIKKKSNNGFIIIDNDSNFKEVININDENYKYKKIKTLTDHYKQIKYIDYNPRLNLFLSYSLDGFINLYIFPKCKLVRSIKVFNITKSENILQKVALVSNPFPMIFAYDSNFILYVFTLNGELINKRELKNKFLEIYPCIDKNFGLINDCVIIERSKTSYNNQISKKEYSFPSFN